MMGRMRVEADRRFLFKKLLQIEGKIGDKKGEERAKEKAREWVMANAAPSAGGEEDDE